MADEHQSCTYAFGSSSNEELVRCRIRDTSADTPVWLFQIEENEADAVIQRRLGCEHPIRRFSQLSSIAHRSARRLDGPSQF
jgi:hypothetical protein